MVMTTFVNFGLGGFFAQLEVANKHHCQQGEEHNLADRRPEAKFLDFCFCELDDVDNDMDTCRGERSQQLRAVYLASLLLPN